MPNDYALSYSWKQASVFVSSFSNVGKRAKILTLLVSSSQLQHSQSEVVRQGETGSAGNNPIFSPDEWSMEFAFSYKAFTAILTPYKGKKEPVTKNEILLSNLVSSNFFILRTHLELQMLFFTSVLCIR